MSYFLNNTTTLFKYFIAIKTELPRSSHGNSIYLTLNAFFLNFADYVILILFIRAIYIITSSIIVKFYIFGFYIIFNYSFLNVISNGNIFTISIRRTVNLF